MQMRKPVVLSGGKSVLRSVLNIFVSQSTEKTSSIGVSFIFNFSKVQVCQCNVGKFEGNSLVGKIVILSRELNQIWGSAVYMDLLKPVDLSGGKSVLRSVLNIFVSQSTEKTSSIGVSFFLIFRKFKFVSVIWESLKEILSSEKKLFYQGNSIKSGVLQYIWT